MATGKCTSSFRNAGDDQGCPDEPFADGPGGQQRFSRVPDPPITSLGRAQAAAAARWIESYVHQKLSSLTTKQLPQSQGLAPPPQVKKIVCSPMRRAVETAAELNKVLCYSVAVCGQVYSALDAAVTVLLPGCELAGRDNRITSV